MRRTVALLCCMAVMFGITKFKYAILLFTVIRQKEIVTTTAYLHLPISPTHSLGLMYLYGTDENVRFCLLMAQNSIVVFNVRLNSLLVISDMTFLANHLTAAKTGLPNQ